MTGPVSGSSCESRSQWHQDQLLTVGLEFSIQGNAETSRCRLRLETIASTSRVSDWSRNAGKCIDQARRTVAPTSDTFSDFLRLQIGT